MIVTSGVAEYANRLENDEFHWQGSDPVPLFWDLEYMEMLWILYLVLFCLVCLNIHPFRQATLG